MCEKITLADLYPISICISRVKNRREKGVVTEGKYWREQIKGVATDK